MRKTGVLNMRKYLLIQLAFLTLFSHAAYNLPSAAKVGSVVQVQTYATASATPNINTQMTTSGQPTNTEGTQVMTLDFTPTKATNKIVVVVNVSFSLAAGDRILTTALFRNSTSGAVAAMGGNLSASGMSGNTTLIYEEIPGSTSLISYKVRCGASSGTWGFMAIGGGAAYGTASRSSIVIYEIEV